MQKLISIGSCVALLSSFVFAEEADDPPYFSWEKPAPSEEKQPPKPVVKEPLEEARSSEEMACYPEECCTCISEECCCVEECPCPEITCFTPAYYDLYADWGLFLSVDFLYWYARESSLTYAGKNEYILLGSETDPSELTLVPIEYEKIDVKWKPGVRIGLGANLPCDGWDVLAEWTYFQNSSSSTISTPVNSQPFVAGDFQLFTPWGQFADETPRSNQVKGKWKLRWNGLDLEMGRRYWVSPKLTIRPFAGLRGGWTKTNFDITATLDENEFAANTVLTSQETNDFENTFWGYGLVCGLAPTFYFTPCFSLFGGMDIALLWGKSKLSLDSTAFAATTDTTTGSVSLLRDFSSNASGSTFGIQPIIDLALGLRYESKFCSDRFLVAVDAGWEHHVWLHHNMRYYTNDLVVSGSGEETKHNIDFGGFVLRLRFDF